MDHCSVFRQILQQLLSVRMRCVPRYSDCFLMMFGNVNKRFFLCRGKTGCRDQKVNLDAKGTEVGRGTQAWQENLECLENRDIQDTDNVIRDEEWKHHLYRKEEEWTGEQTNNMKQLIT
ncbi:hypothetical protein AMECASPLE_032211 [Ameca splendens]|uniref:Uncharacterized protein n=1 Tax=Ameca splendens TaxID=208324 RepID=A0ABV0ZSM2_9TELE